MSNTVIIGIDHGNFQMKTRNHDFNAKLTEYSEAPGERNQLNNILIYKNRYFEVSNKNGEIRIDKTDSEEYWLLTMIAIAKEYEKRNLNPRSTEVRLAVGLPAGFYSESSVKEFKEYLRQDEVLVFTYNNVNYQIPIKSIDVYAQGLGTIIYTNNKILEECRDQFVLIDIGGGTSEIINIENGKLMRQSMTSEVKGMISLLAEVRQKCKMSLHLPFNDKQILRILDGNVKTKTDRDVKEIAECVMKDFVRSIINTAVSFEMYLNIMPVFLTGGGAKYLHKYFKEITESSYIYYEPNVRANAIGFEMISEMKYQDAA